MRTETAEGIHADQDGDFQEWTRWAKSNLERGCRPDEISEILGKNGFENVASRLKLPISHSDSKGKETYNFERSSELVPSVGSSPFHRIDTPILDIFVCEDFLNRKECEHICELIEGNAVPSTVTLNSSDPSVRTSSTCHLSAFGDQVLERIESKISESLGISREFAEGIQGQKYLVGEEFKAHTDYFEPGTPEFDSHAAERGQRTWTFMIYLNDTERGGETYFPRIDCEFRPQLGTAVVWNNLLRDGLPNPNSLHHGKPVEKGKKIIITKWFRSIGEGAPFLEDEKVNDAPPELEPSTTQTDCEKRHEITDECVKSIHEKIVLGISAISIKTELQRKGYDERTCDVLVDTIETFSLNGDDLLYQNRVKKLDWVLTTLCSLRNLVECSSIEEVEKIDPDRFFDSFYAQNRPLICRGYALDSELSKGLRWARLMEKFEDRAVEVQANRDSNDDYERNYRRHRAKVRFGDFMSTVLAGHESNDRYMTANNLGSNRDFVMGAVENFPICPELLATENQKNGTFLWIGPKGTKTPLHHDLTNNLMIQIRGSKEIKLIPPEAYFSVYNDRHCYSKVDIEDPDFEAFPRFRDAPVFTVTLNEGDLLFLPICWWHSVKSLSPSLTITATNFKRRNNFSRDHAYLDNLM